MTVNTGVLSDFNNPNICDSWITNGPDDPGFQFSYELEYMKEAAFNHLQH